MDTAPIPTIGLERAFYIGNTLCGILYGIQICLCYYSVHCIRGSHFPENRKKLFIAYSYLVLMTMTVSFACNALFGQYVWIEWRDSMPPGVSYLTRAAWWANVMGSAFSNVTTVLSDGLLLYRLFMIFVQSTWLTVFPLVLFLASTSLGVVSVIISAQPNNSLLRGRAAQFGLAWMSISVSFNVIVTLMISIRLLLAHRRFRKYTSQGDVDAYTGIVTILVESACPLALSGLVTVGLYSQEHVATYAAAMIWGFFVGASPQLIILRVALGKAWSSRKMPSDMQAPSTLRFQNETAMIELAKENLSGSSEGASTR